MNKFGWSFPLDSEEPYKVLPYCQTSSEENISLGGEQREERHEEDQQEDNKESFLQDTNLPDPTSPERKSPKPRMCIKLVKRTYDQAFTSENEKPEHGESSGRILTSSKSRESSEPSQDSCRRLRHRAPRGEKRGVQSLGRHFHSEHAPRICVQGGRGCLLHEHVRLVIAYAICQLPRRTPCTEAR